MCLITLWWYTTVAVLGTIWAKAVCKYMHDNCWEVSIKQVISGVLVTPLGTEYIQHSHYQGYVWIITMVIYMFSNYNT